MEYQTATEIIKSSVLECDKLSGCRITDAFPPEEADNPVKQTICAVGVLGAQTECVVNGKTNRQAGSQLSLFADIYTPASLGGTHCSDCALALANSLCLSQGKYSIEINTGRCEFISSCRAYKTRIVFQFASLSQNKQYSDLGPAFNILINGSPYMCRSIIYKSVPLESCVESYGEAYPTAFYRGSIKVEAAIERYTTDDQKTLEGIEHPFTLESESKHGKVLSECAVLEYERNEEGFERVKIIGKDEQQ